MGCHRLPLGETAVCAEMAQKAELFIGSCRDFEEPIKGELAQPYEVPVPSAKWSGDLPQGSKSLHHAENREEILSTYDTINKYSVPENLVLREGDEKHVQWKKSPTRSACVCVAIVMGMFLLLLVGTSLGVAVWSLTRTWNCQCEMTSGNLSLSSSI